MAAAVAGAEALAKHVAISYYPVGRTRGTGSRTNLDTAIAGSLSTCQALAWSKNGCVALAVSGEYYCGRHGATRAEAILGARSGPVLKARAARASESVADVAPCDRSNDELPVTPSDEPDLATWASRSESATLIAEACGLSDAIA